MMEKTKRVRWKWILRIGFCLALIAAMVLIGAVLAGAEEVKYSEGLKFTSNGDGTCSVSGIGSCTDTEIVIPPVSPEGDSVTAIGMKAFQNNKSITSILIPNGVTKIGNKAFYYCENLKSIQLSAQLESIEKQAFQGCKALEEITFPDGLTKLGEAAFGDCEKIQMVFIPKNVKAISYNPFMGCDSLYSIMVDDNNPFFYDVNNCVIQNTTNTLCIGLSNTVIPDDGSVSVIGGYAFAHMRNNTNLTIPSTIKTISDYAFMSSSGLTDIVLNFGIESIGSWAFGGCTSLKKVEIPNSVTYLGKNAFYGCSSLHAIDISDGIYTIEDQMFVNCVSLTEVSLPKNLTSIKWAAFSSCSSLVELDLPDGLTSIGSEAFQYCSSLKKIQIPNEVTGIGDYAFRKCYSLTSINIPENVKNITREMFYRCSSLEAITIPSNITSFRSYAFYWCEKLKTITIPNTLTSIGDWTFYGTGLTDVYYLGTKEEWNKISIGDCNYGLRDATIHFLGDIESKLTSASVTLGDSLSLNYYATLNPAHTAAQMRFTYHGETTLVSGVLDEASGEYKFTFGRIPPQCMGDNVKAELILISEDGTETVLDVKESYSIREYCDDALAANPNNKTLATLLADLLAYGDAAQDYANYNEDTPAGDGFEVAPTEWEAVTDTDLTLSDKTSDTVYFAAAGVRFDYINRVYFKIKAADLTGVTLTVNGKTYTADDLILVENTADTYVLYTDAVYATEFDKVFTAKLAVNSEELQTVTYSVRSYVYTKQNSNDTELAALVRALYNYGRSAIAYKNAQ